MPELTIESRFRGPPASGNGGYVCGALARFIGGSGEVTLRGPPPLERPLQIRVYDGGTASLSDGDLLLAEAKRQDEALEAPEPVTFEAAQEATRCPAFDESDHQLPMCFVCGPDRADGDGMRLFAGLTQQARNQDALLAVPWIPDARFPHSDGRPQVEMIWAALDCPTGYAAYHAFSETMLLGRMSVRLNAAPRLDEPCVISAKVAAREGRKILVDAALYGAESQLLAAARNTWIVVPRAVQLGSAAGGTT